MVVEGKAAIKARKNAISRIMEGLIFSRTSLQTGDRARTVGDDEPDAADAITEEKFPPVIRSIPTPFSILHVWINSFL